MDLTIWIYNAFDGYKEMSLKQRIKRFSAEKWNIGFIRNELKGILDGDSINVSWLKHKAKDSWFADPFILDVNESEIIILVEEFPKATNKGRITKLTIDKASFELKKNDVVLELPTHLSFPLIIRSSSKDMVYLLPENGASGKLTLYRYWVNENRLEEIGPVLDEDVADAVPLKVGIYDFLFCTKAPNANGNTLFVYIWDEGKKKYEFCREYIFDENVARMAGCFFEFNGDLYRPTQECNIQYGHAVTIQKLISDSEQMPLEMAILEGRLKFEEVRRLYSVNPQLNVGMHTFNIYQDCIVTDSLGFDNMWIRKILRALQII